jgi:glycosyltransferase involved in cell wall biosynthesis
VDIDRRDKMVMKPGFRNYQRGLELAESGRQEEAFECFAEHLKNNPGDGQAWNDAGAVLYCLRRVDEAIKYFEKARGFCSGPELGEVYWNMCEAYIERGNADLAAGLFDEMEQLGILNVDIINRTANVFLEQGSYDGAVKMLLRSLSLSPNQEILYPMIEVIRSKRVKIAFCASHLSKSIKNIYDFVKENFPTELHIGKNAEQIHQVLEWCDVAWFEGCDEVVSRVSECENNQKIIVRVHNEDVYEGRIKLIDWKNVDVVILGSDTFVREAFFDSVGTLGIAEKTLTMDGGIEFGGFELKHREQGKNLACVCDLVLRTNPMFLLQCMQKLNYLDSEYRLYIAGEFSDKATEQYINHMVETLGLSETIYFEGKVENLSSWFSDKHYVVWTGIGSEGLEGALWGMACGLKPVIHNFPGSQEIFDSEFLFNLSEDFCKQVLSRNYEPQRYMEFVKARYNFDKQKQAVNDILIQLEKEIMVEPKNGGVENQVTQYAGEVCVAPLTENIQQVQPIERKTVDSEDSKKPKRKIIPIKPLGAEHVTANPVYSHEEDYIDVTPISSEPVRPMKTEKQESPEHESGGINGIAAEALEASHALSSMIDQHSGNDSFVDKGFEDAAENDFGRSSYIGPENAAEDNKIDQVISEFCGEN